MDLMKSVCVGQVSVAASVSRPEQTVFACLGRRCKQRRLLNPSGCCCNDEDDTEETKDFEIQFEDVLCCRHLGFYSNDRKCFHLNSLQSSVGN